MADFIDSKISGADFTNNDITSIPGTTVLGNADELKQRFDAAVKNVVVPKLNALIDALIGATAANQIGNAPLTPLGGATVGDQLRYLMDQLNAVTLGQVPDGSITDQKLSQEAGQVLYRLERAAPLDSPALTGSPTAPKPDMSGPVWETNRIATVGAILDALIPVDNHVSNTGIHVTEESKALWNRWNTFSPPALLWAGSWNSGSITVPNLNQYTGFKIGMAGNGTAIWALRHQTDGTGGLHLRGIGGYSSATPTVIFYHFAATISDNILTFVACNAFTQIPGGGHGPVGDTLAVTGIWGL